jgi:DNA-binding SARP family transcriptional activator
MVENGSRILDEAALPSRQGRVAFAYLALQRLRQVQRFQLADAVWGEETPDGWDASLSALLSRLRRLFRDAGLDADIETLSGAVSLRLPPETHIDLSDARSALDLAEGAARSGDAAGAWSNANVAVSILERGFLDGEELPWIVKERLRQRHDLLRGLECLAQATLTSGQFESSVDFSRRCEEIEPFQESAYAREMRAHLAMGNRAEALRTYDRLRNLLSEELGTDPSPRLQALYLEALGS